MKYEIKPCVEGDADRIWEKDFEVYKSFVPTENGAEEERLVFKITDESGIIGGCVLDIDPSKTAEFERLWVDECYRRQGMASALIRAAERAAQVKGCHLVINAYCFDFQGARPLFEKLDYRIIGITKNWPKGHESYTLVKRLDNISKDCFLIEPIDPVKFEIKPGSEDDGAFIADKLEAYNNSIAPRTHPYLDLDKKIVDDKGNMIAGCIAGVSGWDTAHIDVIWVDEPYRGQGIGSYLLSEIEREAKENGAYLARTDAMELQMAFFKKHSYTVNVVYEDDPKLYVMQKAL